MFIFIEEKNSLLQGFEPATFCSRLRKFYFFYILHCFIFKHKDGRGIYVWTESVFVTRSMFTFASLTFHTVISAPEGHLALWFTATVNHRTTMWRRLTHSLRNISTAVWAQTSNCQLSINHQLLDILNQRGLLVQLREQTSAGVLNRWQCKHVWKLIPAKNCFFLFLF